MFEIEIVNRPTSDGSGDGSLSNNQVLVLHDLCEYVFNLQLEAKQR